MRQVLQSIAALALLALAGCQSLAPVTDTPTFAAEAAPQPTACPKDVPASTRCLGGRDSAGAFYLIAIPADWNGHLVLHAHGGPLLGAPRAERVAEDLTRWAIVPRAGYAWAGSSFRQGGVAVRAAAEDTERLRQLVQQHLKVPGLTLLHGQSWGASVAAKGAETYTRTTDGKRPYDGVLLTSGVLGGGTRSYDFRLDLRVVYQQLCNNHPRPDEPAYPLWMGLPAGSKLNQAELSQRTRDCLGLGLPASQRTPAQAHRLKQLTDVLRIPERSVQGHLNWATFHFADIAHQRSGGQPVFGNIGVRYAGLGSEAADAALNAAVPRYAADPAAVAAFAADTDPTGRIPVPVLTVHGVGDAIAFVELDHQFAQTMAAAGAGDRLVQTFTHHAEHSYLADPVYPALLGALQDWVSQGRKPTPADVASRCQSLQGRYGQDCGFLPDYRPAPLDSRVPPRQRP